MIKWICLLLGFAISLLGHGQEHSNSEQPRSVEQLESEIAKGQRRLDNGALSYREIRKFRRELLESWSIEEAKLYLGGFPKGSLSDWADCVVERWAYLNPDELIAGFMTSDGLMDGLLEEGGRGLDGNIAEAVAGAHWTTLSFVLSGWSRKDPHAAWEAVYGLEGRISKLSLLHDGFGYLAPKVLGENLARVDPVLAWKKFENFPKRKYRNLYRESMLFGMSEGLKDDSNWQEVLEKAIGLSGADLDRLDRVISVNLMARWFEHDAAGAERWFRSEKAEKISTEEGEMSLDSSFFRFLTGGEVNGDFKIKMKLSLAPAIAHWIGRDPEGSLAWIKNRPEMVKELFEKASDDLGGQLSREKWRQFIVESFQREAREEFLLEMLKVDRFQGNPLGVFVSVGKREKMREAIKELEISDEMGERIIEKMREGYLLDDE